MHLPSRLAPNATRVLSRIRFLPNPDAPAPVLLPAWRRPHRRLDPDRRCDIAIRPVPGGIEADVPASPFTFEAEFQIDPAANTALEALHVEQHVCIMRGRGLPQDHLVPRPPRRDGAR
ncbi:MAG: hypothetical protein R3D85_13220 [Paracoccaceae bacterium]